jgi:hypothetical protein
MEPVVGVLDAEDDEQGSDALAVLIGRVGARCSCGAPTGAPSPATRAVEECSVHQEGTALAEENRQWVCLALLRMWIQHWSSSVLQQNQTQPVLLGGQTSSLVKMYRARGALVRALVAPAVATFSSSAAPTVAFAAVERARGESPPLVRSLTAEAAATAPASLSMRCQVVKCLSHRRSIVARRVGP